MFYTEVKRGHTIYLTDTAWKFLVKMAVAEGTSASEVVERWIRADIGENSVTLSLD
ncbi:hypothetical protein NUACC26_054780 [Scytonema sp. NUACC26]